MTSFNFKVINVIEHCNMSMCQVFGYMAMDMGSSDVDSSLIYMAIKHLYRNRKLSIDGNGCVVSDGNGVNVTFSPSKDNMEMIINYDIFGKTFSTSWPVGEMIDFEM